MPKIKTKHGLPIPLNNAVHENKRTLRDSKDLYDSKRRNRVRHRQPIPRQHAPIHNVIDNPVGNPQERNPRLQLHMNRLSLPSRLIMGATLLSLVGRLNADDAVSTFAQHNAGALGHDQEGFSSDAVEDQETATDTSATLSTTQDDNIVVEHTNDAINNNPDEPMHNPTPTASPHVSEDTNDVSQQQSHDTKPILVVESTTQDDNIVVEHTNDAINNNPDEPMHNPTPTASPHVSEDTNDVSQQQSHDTKPILVVGSTTQDDNIVVEHTNDAINNNPDEPMHNPTPTASPRVSEDTNDVSQQQSYKDDTSISKEGASSTITKDCVKEVDLDFNQEYQEESSSTVLTNENNLHEDNSHVIHTEDELLNRVKRGLGDPILSHNELTQLGKNLLSHDQQTSVLFQNINDAIRDNQSSDLWNDPSFLKQFDELFQKAKLLINTEGEKPHLAKTTISLEIFSQFNAQRFSSDPLYATIFFNTVDKLPIPGAPIDLSFLPQFQQTSSAKDKVLLFTLLHFFEHHPSITPEVLATLSADVHLQFKEEQYDKYLNTKLNLEQVRKEVQQKILTDNPGMNIPTPIFFLQDLYLGDNRYMAPQGYCYPLSAAYIYYVQQYGIDNAQLKMKELFKLIEKIHKLSFKDSLEYQKGIFLFSIEMQKGALDRIPLEQQDFNWSKEFHDNTHHGLSKEQLVDLLFDPTFAPNKQYFYLSERSHITSIVRTFEVDPITNARIPVIHYFDANAGLFTTASKEALKATFNLANLSNQNLKLIEANPKVSPQFITRSGAEFIDFLLFQVIGNPKFKVSIIEDPNNFSNANIAVVETHNKKTGFQVDIKILLKEYKAHMRMLNGMRNHYGLQYLTPLKYGIDISSFSMYEELIATLNTDLSTDALKDIVSKITDISTEISRNLQDFRQKFKNLGTMKPFFENFETVVNRCQTQTSNWESQFGASNWMTNTLSFEGFSMLSSLLTTDDLGGDEKLNRMYTNNEPESNNQVLLTEKELREAGLWSFEESNEMKHTMQTLDDALETLIKTSDLNPNDYIAIELENIKSSAMTMEEFDVLQQDYIDVINVKDNTVKRLSTKNTLFQTIGKKLYSAISSFNNKLISLNNKMGIPYKGLALYSTISTLSAARSMIDQGKTFQNMNAFDKTKYITNTLEATLDVPTNVIGAVNKIYKTIHKPLNALSKVSRISSKVSGAVGIAASGIRFGISAAEYSMNPNKMNEVTLIFDGIDLGLSVVMASYPASAVVLLPLSLILDFIKSYLLHALKIEEAAKQIDSIISQLELEADGITKRKNIMFKNGVATLETFSGDVVKITMIDDRMEVTLTAASGNGFHIYPPNHASPSNPVVPPNTEHVSPVGDGVVFPDKSCIQSAPVKQTTTCLNEKLDFAFDWCSNPNSPEQQDFYYVDVKNKAIPYNKLIKETTSSVTESIPVNEKMKIFYLQPQYKTYKEVHEYAFSSYDLSRDAVVNMNHKYRGKDKVHRLAQCSSFDAIHATKAEKVNSGKYTEYPSFVLHGGIGPIKSKGPVPTRVNWDYAASYLSQCFVIGRQKIEVDFSSVKEAPMLILPNKFQTSLDKIEPYIPEELQHLASRGSVKTYPKGTMITFIESGNFMGYPGFDKYKTKIKLYIKLVEPDSIHKEDIFLKNVFIPFPKEHLISQGLQQEIGCKLGEGVTLPAHNPYSIYGGTKEAIQIVLQGNNKITLLPPKTESSQKQNSGFMLYAEDVTLYNKSNVTTFLKNVAPNSTLKNPLQQTMVKDIVNGMNKSKANTGPNPSLQANKINIIKKNNTIGFVIGNTIVDLTNVDDNTPVYLRVAGGFILKWDSILEQFSPVLYDNHIHSSDVTEKEQILKIDPTINTGKDIAVALRGKLSLAFVNKNSVNDYSFPIKGLELQCKTSEGVDKTMLLNNSVYKHKKDSKSEVIYLHLPKELPKELESIDYNAYSLFHVDEGLYDFQELSDVNKKEGYTAYFYNERDNSMIIQKGEKLLSKEDIIPLKEKPSFVFCEDGQQRVFINGIVTCYDSNGYPIERKMKADTLGYPIEEIDRQMDIILHKMEEGQKESFFDNRNVVVYNIPYVSSTGKQYSITIQKSLKNPAISFFIPEYKGKKLSLLTKPLKGNDGILYSYYLMKDEIHGGKQSIIAFPMIENLSSLGTGKAIHESNLPKPVTLLEDIEIDKYYTTGSSLIIKTKTGLFLQAVLDGKQSSTKVLRISEEYLESRGYDINNPVSTHVGIYETELLHGETLTSLLEIANNFDSSSSIADKRSGIVLPTHKDNFYKLAVNVHRSQILPKPLKSRTVRDTHNTQEEQTSADTWKSSSDLIVKGYTTHVEKDKSIVYMWDKSSQTYIVSPEHPTQNNPPRTYALENLLENQGKAFVRFSDKHVQKDNKGLIIPGAPELLIESSSMAQGIQLNYGQQEMLYIDNLILDHKKASDTLPICNFITEQRTFDSINVPSIIVKSNAPSQDLYVYVLRADSTDVKPQYTVVTLKQFFAYDPNTNPYNNIISMNGHSYSGTQLLSLQEQYVLSRLNPHEKNNDMQEEEESLIL